MKQRSKTISAVKKIIGVFFLANVISLPYVSADGCTSAIISAGRSASGRPMLWKHRDTSAIDNKVEYVAPTDGSYGYVALFNADDKQLEQAWTGMNEVGFAIMNTASYNIKNDNVPETEMDREGYVMTIALKTCRTVNDFEQLLEKLPRPMGVEANFGVIDADGNGAYFETNNDSFIKFDLNESETGILIRTNYSHSGRPSEGYGYIREQNATDLFAALPEGEKVTPEYLTETMSRSFLHSLMNRDFVKDCNDRWVIDQDFIPRYKSTATIVIEGCDPETGSPSDYIMWTGLGYPPVAEIVPVWCSADGVDTRLRGLCADGHSELSDIAKKRRDEVFPIHRGSGDHYIDMQRLVNDKGTGYIQIIVPQNLETYRLFRSKNPK